MSIYSIFAYFAYYSIYFISPLYHCINAIFLPSCDGKNTLNVRVLSEFLSVFLPVLHEVISMVNRESPK